MSVGARPRLATGFRHRIPYLGLHVALLIISLPSLAAEPVALAITRHPLDFERPFETGIGRLEHRGTIEIKSGNARFGGFSALTVGEDGAHFVALNDNGDWLSGRFEFDALGWLSGVSSATIDRIAGLEGRPLARKRDRDAEAMTRLADGSVLVAFEETHRIWRFPPGPEPLAGTPVTFPSPPDLDLAPGNMGIEALAALGDGRILALTEGLVVEDGMLRGWLWEDGRWLPIGYRRTGDYRPTDAALLPDGDVVVVERRFSILAGLGIRVARIARRDLAPDAVIETTELARLSSPQVIDNFEGISAHRSPDGRTLLYLIADDNFSPLQRTLVALFAMVE